MRSLIRPIGLLCATLFLSLFFINTALAFECTNAGAGFTAPDDGDVDIQTACGNAAVASGTASTAVGASALASGSGSTALGNGADATGSNSTAVGWAALASGSGSTTLGTGADATGSNSTAVGWAADAIHDDSTAVGKSATASGFASTALGRSALANGSTGTALGDSTTASGIDGTAVGRGAEASGSGSTALGRSAKAIGNQSTAAGRGAMASGTKNTTLGYNASALSPHSNATALGFQAMVEQSNAMVLGSIPGVNEPFFLNEYVDVGIGTTTPNAPLHIFRDDETLEFMFLESDAAGGAQDRAMMQLSNNGGIRFQFDNTLTSNAWRFQAGTGNQDNFEITSVGSGQLELLLQNDGDLIIAGSLIQNSDVNAKQDIEAVDGDTLLAKLDTLPVAEWTYKRDSSGARHLGPMAQDFHAAFGLGEDETKIAPGDMAGISLAAIKALKAQHEKAMAEKEAQLITLQQEKDAEIAEVKDRLARLESLIQGLNRPTAGL